MPRFPSFLLTAAFALALAGCDRESAETAQPEGSGEVLAGKVDRAFADQAMPAVELSDPEGATLAMGDLRGKPVLVNLWATWCVPCVTEMPLLDALAGELGDSVTVLTVSEDMEGAAKVVPFFAARDLQNLPQWMDTENKLAVAYGGGAGLPLTVLYDAEGKELWRIAGGYDWAGAEARELIAEATGT